MHLLAIGGSDGGISAALRARELDPSVDVTVILADAYPNFSICGIPYYLSGDVADWHSLAHRSRAHLQDLGVNLLTDTVAERIDAADHRVTAVGPGGPRQLSYDKLVIATGAVPARPPIVGLDQFAAGDGVHQLHTMGDTHAVMATLTRRSVPAAVIIGAGYIGLEMAEALTARGIAVTQLEQLPEVLPTLDAELGQGVADELRDHDVEVHTSTRVAAIEAEGDQLVVRCQPADGSPAFQRRAGMVMVVTGVSPHSALAAAAGVETTPRGAIKVDRYMRTNLPDVFAAGDCVVTHHILLGESYLPLGTTAHKQGRIAGENAVGGQRRFAGSAGTQAVKVFDLVAARTGIRDHEALAAGYQPRTVPSTAYDHKVYYPGAQTVHVHTTGDATTGRLLGVQMVGAIATAVHKRIDTAAAALFAHLSVDQLNDLDLSYTPPLGSPWDVLQAAAQQWMDVAEARGTGSASSAQRAEEAPDGVGGID